MNSWKQGALLALILLAALALRWTGLDWDGYNHYHPDERYITWVATTIEWPDSFAEAFDPQNSPLNPFYWPPGAESQGIEVLQDQRRDFAYGHVPLYMGVAATRIMERLQGPVQALLPAAWLVTSDIFNGSDAIEFRHLTAVSRALTGLIDAATILLIFMLGRMIFSPAVGLLAAGFLAFNVMHIQLAHFFTVDPYLTFFGIAALYFMVRAYDVAQALEVQSTAREKFLCSPLCNLLLAALFVGLAIGAKFSAAMFFLPLAAAAWLALPAPRWWRLAAVFATAVAAFALTNPFALLDFGCEALTMPFALGPLHIPALDWRSCYLANIFKQGAMVQGQSDLGFTRQYDGTLPYLYYVEMQLRWGMGWPLGLLAFAAFGWITWLVSRTLIRRRDESEAESGPLPVQTTGILLLLLWAVPFFLVTGSFHVKFMRYLMPLTPLLMLFAAALVFALKSSRARWALALLVLLPTAVYAAAFLNIYRGEHPWTSASLWVYENVPPGELLASEQWDDALPTTLVVEGRVRRRGEYQDVALTWLTGPDERDNEAKLQANLETLAEADYVTLLSNRIYGVVPRLEGRYPLSHVYHQLLFDGDLGYEPVYSNTRMPGLFGLYLWPDPFVWPGLEPTTAVDAYLATFPRLNGGRFDESFTVYDQPLVMIFKNVEHRSAAELRSAFPQP